MCLTSVDYVKRTKAPITCYKAGWLKGSTEMRGMLMHQTNEFKVGERIRAEYRSVLGNAGNMYISGFHMWETKADAIYWGKNVLDFVWCLGNEEPGPFHIFTVEIPAHELVVFGSCSLLCPFPYQGTCSPALVSGTIKVLSVEPFTSCKEATKW